MPFEYGDPAWRGEKFCCGSDAPPVVGSEMQHKRTVPV